MKSNKSYQATSASARRLNSAFAKNNMIEKTKSSSLLNFFGYLIGNDPQDEWNFEIRGVPCRFLNGWRSGASLYINGEEKDKTGKLFSVDGKKPLLSGKIKDSEGIESTVSVHVKAVTEIKIQVRLDNEPIHEGFK